MKKIIIWVVVILVLAVIGLFASARFLVSKLNGEGNVPMQHQTLLQFSSEDGVSFMYPDTYELASHSEGTAERKWDVLVLLPKGYTPPQNGEGPPTITMSVFRNPEGMSVDAWVKGDARSNWKMTVDDRASHTTTVGGQNALWYHYSGLYETDAVAVAEGGKIVLFTVGYLSPDDTVRQDFNNLIKTVHFN